MLSKRASVVTHLVAAQNWTPLPSPLPFRRGEGEASAAPLRMVSPPQLIIETASCTNCVPGIEIKGPPHPSPLLQRRRGRSHGRFRCSRAYFNGSGAGVRGKGRVG